MKIRFSFRRHMAIVLLCQEGGDYHIPGCDYMYPEPDPATPSNAG